MTDIRAKNQSIIISAISLLIFILLLLIGIEGVNLKTLTRLKEMKVLSSIDLLDRTVLLSGNKSIAKETKKLDQITLQGKNAIEITYNLYGLCMLKGDAGSIIFTQKDTAGKLILADYINNCSSGIKSLILPLSQIEGLLLDKPLSELTFSVWHPSDFKVEISTIRAVNLQQNVLGTFINPKKTDEISKYLNQSPLRPFPYAKENLP